VTKLSEKIETERKWRLEGDSNRIWEEMDDCIRRSAREDLGVSKEGSGRMKGAWWWNAEVKGKVKAKQEKYKALISSSTDEEKEVNKVQYRITKKDAKKAVVVVNNDPYERLYQILNSQEGENEVFKLARARERRTRDLGSVKGIKDEDGKVLVEDTKVQERWQSYFYKLFNGEGFEVSQHIEYLPKEEQQDFRPCRIITKEEVKEALRKMKVGKVVGPDNIPVEI